MLTALVVPPPRMTIGCWVGIFRSAISLAAGAAGRSGANAIALSDNIPRWRALREAPIAENRTLADSHQEELSAISTVPNMEAPGPATPARLLVFAISVAGLRLMRGALAGFARDNFGFDRPAFRASEAMNLVALKDEVGLDRIQS